MARASRPTSAKQLDKRLDSQGELGDRGGLDLDKEDLAALRASIAESEAQFARGEYVSSEQALAELDAILSGP